MCAFLNDFEIKEQKVICLLGHFSRQFSDGLVIFSGFPLNYITKHARDNKNAGKRGVSERHCVENNGVFCASKSVIIFWTHVQILTNIGQIILLPLK